jgi:hypothetical protein
MEKSKAKCARAIKWAQEQKHASSLASGLSPESDGFAGTACIDMASDVATAEPSKGHTPGTATSRNTHTKRSEASALCQFRTISTG